jgi:hypothetical protein
MKTDALEKNRDCIIDSLETYFSSNSKYPNGLETFQFENENLIFYSVGRRRMEYKIWYIHLITLNTCLYNSETKQWTEK